jgi:hypothetical protein
MKKAFVLITAAMLAGSALSGVAVALDRPALSANQITDQFNARTARIKADLRLTPEQDKNWSGFESAMVTMGKQNADREIARRDEQTQQKVPIDIIGQMRLQARYLSERSADRKALADAAAPLYTSLDGAQKQRFSNELIGISRGRDDD